MSTHAFLGSDMRGAAVTGAGREFKVLWRIDLTLETFARGSGRFGVAGEGAAATVFRGRGRASSPETR